MNEIKQEQIKLKNLALKQIKTSCENIIHLITNYELKTSQEQLDKINADLNEIWLYELRVK